VQLSGRDNEVDTTEYLGAVHGHVQVAYLEQRRLRGSDIKWGVRHGAPSYSTSVY